MGSVLVAESAVIDARPEVIYSILADYRDEHPRILPRQYFQELTILRGGQGAGTVFRARVRVLGTETRYEMVVSEPEPGHMLVETDASAGVVTTFTVSPIGDGNRTNLEIATTWTTRGSLAGFLQGLMTPLVSRPMYRTELQLVASYVASRQHKTDTIGSSSR